MIETMQFGGTGHASSRTIFGSAALWSVSQHEADKAFDLLESYGVNHIDTARSYGDAEVRIGSWMRRHRSRFFLATKTGKRTKDEALQELSESLDRLQTDHVDLWQFHSLTDEKEWETVFQEGGALEAALEAKRQGMIRYIGVTGHGLDAPKMHLKSLGRFDFDSVLFPYNYPLMQDSGYARSAEELLQLCSKKKIAAQTIKSLARRNAQEGSHPYTTWYEPLDEQEAVELAVLWVLKDPRVFLNTTGDLTLLPKVLQAALMSEPFPSDKQMEQAVKKWGITKMEWWP